MLEKILRALEAEAADGPTTPTQTAMLVNVVSVPTNHHIHPDGRCWPFGPSAAVTPPIEQIDQLLAETAPVSVPIESDETLVALPIDTVVAFPRRPAEQSEPEPEPV